MNNVAEVLKSDTLIQRFKDTGDMNYNAEYGFAIQQLKGNEYLMKIAQQDTNSLMQAMCNVAACGLSLNPAEKQAYLIPRKGKICFDPSYMGLIRLATNTGSIEWVQAYCVHECDEFRLMGAGEKPVFESDPFAWPKEGFRGAFCVAKTKQGDYLTTPMSAAEIHAVRDSSESVKKWGLENPKAGPWVTHFEEMAKKTVIRRAFKTWTLTDHNQNDIRMAQAVHISNENEDVVLALSAPDLGQYSDEAKTYFDQLIEKSDASGMVVFKHGKSEAEWTNLYHSFEKGTKGKYQKVIDELYLTGNATVMDYTEQVNQHVAAGMDIDVLLEEMEELRPLVEERVSNEAAQVMGAAA